MIEPEYGHPYKEVEIESATVISVINYTKGAEYREYNVDGGQELADLLHDIKDPQLFEEVVSVDVEKK
jgi:hypothetical protein